tara:strand:+ start:728 stop:922 length:195 start_codon:yes stop_codon:yes gene_type:complete
MKKYSPEDLKNKAYHRLDLDDTFVVKMKKNKDGLKVNLIDYAYKLEDIISTLEKINGKDSKTDT